MWRTHSQPLGQSTRGKTAPNRLRRLDTYVLRTERGLIARSGPQPYVDLGFGFWPVTTLDSLHHFRQVNPVLPALGVEISAERVAEAQRFSDSLTQFRRGGFDIPLQGVQARLIRAMNVLRQYDEGEVEQAWSEMCAHLVEGGLLIEGTSCPTGRVIVVNLIRRTGRTYRHEGVLFSTNFREGFDPEMFQPRLPKNLIHRMIPGEPIHGFMESWKRAFRGCQAHTVFGPRDMFVHTARALAALDAIEQRPALWRQGFVRWRLR